MFYILHLLLELIRKQNCRLIKLSGNFPVFSLIKWNYIFFTFSRLILGENCIFQLSEQIHQVGLICHLPVTGDLGIQDPDNIEDYTANSGKNDKCRSPRFQTQQRFDPSTPEPGCSLMIGSHRRQCTYIVQLSI